MHLIKVLAFGSENFNISLKELKDYLNFELTTTNDDPNNIVIEKYDVLLIHEDGSFEKCYIKLHYISENSQFLERERR